MLDGGNDQSRADLEVAKMYLVELEQAAAAAAAEYNAAVGQLHRMIYAQLDGPREAGKALQQLKAAAARAEALGAPAEIIDAAQEKATTLHLAHVELLQTQALAEVCQCMSACPSLTWLTWPVAPDLRRRSWQMQPVRCCRSVSLPSKPCVLRIHKHCPSGCKAPS